MTDAVKLALIQMVGTLITTAGVACVAYFTYGMKKVSHNTNTVVTETKEAVAVVHEQTNGRLLRAEAQVAALTAERDRLLAEAGARRQGDQ